MLNVLDEFTHECLAIRVARKLKAIDVIDVLSDLFILRGVPGHIRSDNGPEFVAKAVQEWISGGRCENRLHRAGQSLGERLHRELQCALARRTPRRRDLLLAAGGADRHRELAAPLQCESARMRLLAIGHQHRRCLCRARRVAGCATSTSSAGHAPAGAETDLKLTFHLDHSVGADHPTTRFAIVPPTTVSISAVDNKFVPILIVPAVRNRSQRAAGSSIGFSRSRYGR